MEFSWKDFDHSNPTPEHKMLREMIRSFVQENVEPQAHQHDREEKFNLELFRKFGELGVLGLTAPEQYGGAALDATAAVAILEELSASDPGFCLAYLAHAMLCVNNIAVNGDETQKALYLPKLCSGEFVGAMAMSEPAVGTDVLGMQTSAVVKAKGGYTLNGRKMWITNGTIDDNKTACDVVIVYAKTGEKKGRAEISTFIVDRTMPGFYVGQKIQDKLGMRGSNTAELVFDNCEVPATHLVGNLGESMLHMMRNLEIERLTLAAMSLGIARRALEIMNKYAEDRQAFGKSLNYFGQIQMYIANSYAEFKAARSYVYETARKLSLHQEGSRAD